MEVAEAVDHLSCFQLDWLSVFLAAYSPLLYAPLSLLNLPALLTISSCLSKHPNAPGLQSAELRLGVEDGKTPESSSSNPDCHTAPFSRRTARCALTMGFAAARGPFVQPTGRSPTQWAQLALPLKILSTATPTCQSACLPAHSAP